MMPSLNSIPLALWRVVFLLILIKQAITLFAALSQALKWILDKGWSKVAVIGLSQEWIYTPEELVGFQAAKVKDKIKRSQPRCTRQLLQWKDVYQQETGWHSGRYRWQASSHRG
jgi:hypothetical protein